MHFDMNVPDDEVCKSENGDDDDTSKDEANAIMENRSKQQMEQVALLSTFPSSSNKYLQQRR